MNQTEEETQQALKTDPPSADHHGFLEQFDTLSHSTFEELQLIAEQGLVAAERIMLFKVGIKLLTLAVKDAKESDFNEEQKREIESLAAEFDSLPIGT